MSQDKWLEWAVRLQALAQTGLAYGKDAYDMERFEEIRQIAAEMLIEPSGQPLEVVKDLFCNETGYQTPKLDTRAAIFQEDKDPTGSGKRRVLVLTRRLVRCGPVRQGQCGQGSKGRSGAGCGGSTSRCDFGQAQEQSCQVSPPRDQGLHSMSSPWREFQPNSETVASGFFSLDDLPPLYHGKNTAEQLALCLEASRSEHWETRFD